MQTAYTQYQAAALVGALFDLSNKTTFSYSAEAAVGLGVPVMLGTNKERQVKLATAAASVIGIAMAQSDFEQSAAGLVQYADKETVSVLKSGRIWVMTADAVTAGNAANMVVASGLFTDEVVATGIEAFTQVSIKFLTSTTAAGLAVVEIIQK